MPNKYFLLLNSAFRMFITDAVAASPSIRALKVPYDPTNAVFNGSKWRKICGQDFMGAIKPWWPPLPAVQVQGALRTIKTHPRKQGMSVRVQLLRVTAAFGKMV